MEVGPLARILTAYHGPAGGPVRSRMDPLLASLGIKLEHMNSVLGRHLSRAIEVLIFPNGDVQSHNAVACA